MYMAADSFVFQIAGQILGKLTTLAFREIGLIWGVKKDFKRLESTLQDVLYDIDDVLDDFLTEDLRRKVLIKGSKRKAVKNFFSSSNSLALRITMSRKLKNIRSRLQDIDADREQFALVERALDSQDAYPLREQTHSFIRASDVIGRDRDKNRIINLLMKYPTSLEMLWMSKCEKLNLLAKEDTMMELPRANSHSSLVKTASDVGQLVKSGHSVVLRQSAVFGEFLGNIYPEFGETSS
ncbi:hypothetical protein LguiA_026388 [Lonicera macranthoides]